MSEQVPNDTEGHIFIRHDQGDDKRDISDADTEGNRMKLLGDADERRDLSDADTEGHIKF